MTLADYDTGKEIVDDMLSRAGELTIDAAELVDEAKRYANRGYYAVLRAFPWLYNEAYPPMQIVTKAKTLLTGMVVNNGSPTITVNETPSTDLITAKVVVDRDGLSCRITNIVGSTITIGINYIGDSGTGLTGYIYQDEYSAPDVLLPTRLRNISDPGKRIDIVGYDELDGRFPVSIPFGRIEMASFYTEEIFRVARITSEAQLLELHYSKRPSRLTFTGGADDIPVLPHDERWLIADYGLYFLLVDHDEEGAAEVAKIVAGRIGEAKDRQIAKMSPRIWIPNAFNFGVRV